MENLMKVSTKELISYSKQKEVPPVTIIENLSKEKLDFVELQAKRLKLNYVLVENSNNVAILGARNVAKKLALDLKKRCQVMFYDFARRPSCNIVIYALTGYTDHWITIKDNGYIINAYDEFGNEIKQWINTNIKWVNPKRLNKLGLSIYRISVSFDEKYKDIDLDILEHSRENYINGGVFNQNRNCYYPVGNTNKDIAERNKIEKLFKKYGFKNI